MVEVTFYALVNVFNTATTTTTSPVNNDDLTIRQLMGIKLADNRRHSDKVLTNHPGNVGMWI